MRKLSAIFRWDHYASARDAFVTAQWFAAWTRLNGDYVDRRATDVFLEVTANEQADYISFLLDLQRHRETVGSLQATIPPNLRQAAHDGTDPEEIAPLRENQHAASASESSPELSAVRSESQVERPVPIVGEHKYWAPNEAAVILRASVLKSQRLAKWVLLDKAEANRFLDKINYKKPFICFVGATVAMLFERYPACFVPYAKRIWLTDLSVYRPNTSQQQAAAMTWLGDGTNLAHAMDDPTLFIDEATKIRMALWEPEEARSAFFQLVIANIKEQFGGLLE